MAPECTSGARTTLRRSGGGFSDRGRHAVACGRALFRFRSCRPPPSPDFVSRLEGYRARIDAHLEHVLPAADNYPYTLHEAMRYAVLGSGKRIRPLLTYAAGEALGVAAERLDGGAAAVELVHAFSLVHDDLPAMDDDDLRRGRPTVHVQFDEATAILAGDALQVLAFEVIAGDRVLSGEPATRLAMLTTLARASGSRGMTGGQAVDLAAAGKRLTLAELTDMHAKKTGLLMRAAVAMACHACPAADEESAARLDRYAELIGLAFQIRDDVLDVEGDTAMIGKPQGSDQGQDKATFPALLGLAGAKAEAERLFDEALATLETLNLDTSALRFLAGYIVRRDR